MIKVNKIIPFTCEAFNPQGESLGFLNEYEYNDLRIQIMKEKATGYYMLYNNEPILIDVFGRPTYHRDGFYDLIDTQINTLLGIY